MIEDMAKLRPDELNALSGALIRLVPSDVAMYQQAGMKISRFLDPSDLVQIREDQERLQLLSTTGS